MSRFNASYARVLALATLLLAGAAAADIPYPGTRTVASKHGFAALVSRVEAAVSERKMGLVAQASASRGAAARGVRIPGNAVLMVFRNDYAVRMLQASVPAGIEAPLRIYVTENADGTASIIYRSDKLGAMAKELDPIFEGIVRDAAGS